MLNFWNRKYSFFYSKLYCCLKFTSYKQKIKTKMIKNAHNNLRNGMFRDMARANWSSFLSLLIYFFLSRWFTHIDFAQCRYSCVTTYWSELSDFSSMADRKKTTINKNSWKEWARERASGKMECKYRILKWKCISWWIGLMELDWIEVHRNRLKFDWNTQIL